MIIKEYRVTLPMTVEEYQVAQLYSVAEASKNETGGGEGVEVIKNEPYTDVPLLNGKFNAGQYTYKIYHLASKVPSWVRAIAPKGSLEIHEEAWNAYPYCKTVLSNPGYMKDGFYIMVETYHIADKGDSANVHELPKDKLNKREVVPIDIAHDPGTSGQPRLEGPGPAGHDLLQAGHRRVQVVGPADQGGAVHHADREEALQQLPPAGLLLDRQVARHDHGRHQGAGGEDQAGAGGRPQDGRGQGHKTRVIGLVSL